MQSLSFANLSQEYSLSTSLSKARNHLFQRNLRCFRGIEVTSTATAMHSVMIFITSFHNQVVRHI